MRTFYLLIVSNFCLKCMASTYLGGTFGSPALVGLRGAYRLEESPLTFQVDYSKQTLYHNRTNGSLSVFRVSLQRESNFTENILPFYFVGLDHFTGYANQFTKTISLVASEIGLGVKLQITKKMIFTSELGLIFPTTAVQGFELIGLALNMGLLFSVSP